MFEKVIQISMLYDFYGQLLTEKQREIMQFYYEDDFSLGEISENLKISRQAVYDTIKKSEKTLQEYEEKLRLYQRFKESEEIYKLVFERIDELIENGELDMNIKKKLYEIKEMIQNNR